MRSSVFRFTCLFLLLTVCSWTAHCGGSDTSRELPQESTTRVTETTTEVVLEPTTSRTVPTTKKPSQRVSESTTRRATVSSSNEASESTTARATPATKKAPQTTKKTQQVDRPAVVTSTPKPVSDNSTKFNSTLAKFLRTLVPIKLPMPTISKSYHTDDPIISYCASVSLKLDPALKKLSDNTLENAPMSGMLGAPEVLQFGQNLIRLIGAKRALDIGTFTGASAFAWALALPPEGEVTSMDVDLENMKEYGKQFIESKPDIAKKITFKLAPAVETLDSMLEAGEKGKWDFAFIDADKINYPNYYEKCVELLRPGGVLLIDNALWGGSVIFEEKDPSTKAIDETNHLIANDTRVDNMLLNLGDGTHVVFKKHQ